MPQKKQFPNQAAKQKAYRERLKRNAEKAKLENSALRFSVARSQLVLELFPGAGLFGAAFKQLGFCVVRGEDILHGGDVREMNLPPGKIDGIIGGAPCQVFSQAAVSGTKAINLIPEFVRLVEQAQPRWAVLENVRGALPYAPDWNYAFLRDWDCGGLTHRIRGFWFYGMTAPSSPTKRPGKPAYTVMASNWNHRGYSTRGVMQNAHKYLSPQEAARLQGYPDLADRIMSHQPGWKNERGYWKGVNQGSREVLATHMIGNGVPRALGEYVANHVLTNLVKQQLGQNTSAFS